MLTDVRSDAFFDAHASRVYALALRITGSSAAAAEIVEELFIAIRTGVRTPDKNVKAWLIRTARDLALARRPNDRSASSTVVTKEGDPRSLVEAAFFGGLSVPELARAFSLTEDEVRRRLRDGMAALRTQFAGTSIR